MLKKYRKSKNFTQERIAEAANIDIRSYQDLEANLSIPLSNTLAKIILALDLNDNEIREIISYYATINNKKGPQ